MTRRTKTRWEGVSYDEVTKTYVARWDLGRDPVTGRRQERARAGFKHELDAKKYRAARLAEIGQGIRRDPKGERVGDFIDRWLSGKVTPETLSAGTIQDRRSIFNAHVKTSAFAQTKLADVGPRHVAEFYAALPLGERSTSTLHRVHRMLFRAFEVALDLELIARNPCAKQALRQPYESPVPVFWTAQDVAVFLKHLEGAAPLGWSRRRPAAFSGMYHACRVDLGTGLRADELLTLQWPQIHLDEDGEGELTVTGKGRKTRTLDLDAWTVAALRDWRRQQVAERLAAKTWAPSDFVWTYADGRRLSYEAFATFLDREIAAAAKVKPLKGPHGMRHTHAVLMLTDHDILYVSRRLGHASTSITDKHYAQVLPQKPSERRTLRRRPFGELLTALAGVAV